MTDSELIMRFIDYPYNEEVLNYIDYVRIADYDVIVFMARKMYCLYMAADEVCQNLSKLRPDRLVIQHNALPFFRNELIGKRILLCDDVSFSATAINTHRNLLIDEYKVRPENIGVSVLFAKEGLVFDFPVDRSPVYLEYGKIRELSQAIVSFIWNAMITYVAYLPSYDAPAEWFGVIQNKYNDLSEKWEQIEITREFLPPSDLRSFCFALREPLGKSQFSCVRIYYNEERNKTTIVPFALIPPISFTSLRQVYEKCGQIFDFPITSDTSDQMSSAMYRLINYIFSGEVFSRFLSDFSIIGNQFTYRTSPDAYSFPNAFAGLGFKLLTCNTWGELWDLYEPELISDALIDYMDTSSSKNDDDIDCLEIIDSLEAANDCLHFLGAMSQYDKKAKLFNKGIPETALRKVMKPSSLSVYFSSLISYLDGAVASINTHTSNKIAYSYLQKGEQACSIFMSNSTISTSALSILYRTIGSKQWKQHFDTISAIYKAYGMKNSNAILDDTLFNILSNTGVDGFYIGHYYDLYQKYGEERSDEIEYFTCFSRLFPEYLNQYDGEHSSVNGFMKYLEVSYPDDDVIREFVQEVSNCAI